MEISTYKEDANLATEHCEKEQGEDCWCGLLFQAATMEARGKKVTSHPKFCGVKDKVEDFALAAPQLLKGKVSYGWQQCKSSRSTNCSSLNDMVPCPDGL